MVFTRAKLATERQLTITQGYTAIVGARSESVYSRVGMGILQSAETGVELTLPERALVGRSSACDLRIERREVSSEHAAVRWIDRRWVAVDLGSRNGTSVDGRLLAAGEEQPVARGAVLRFACDDERWILRDDGPPELFARSDVGERRAIGGILVLPDDSDPRVTIYRGGSGVWLADDGARSVELEDRQRLEVAGVRWRLHLPGSTAETWDISGPTRSLGLATLHLLCSRDEEKILATLTWSGEAIELGYRAHHALLLQLIRARQGDDARGFSSADSGWVHGEELARQLGVDVAHLNILIYRLRRQLAAAEVVDAAAIIERRGRSGELRLGALRRATLELRGKIV